MTTSIKKIGFFMFHFRLLILLFIVFSAKASETKLFTWEDRISGNFLRISATGVNKENKPWVARETQLSDTPFYQRQGVTQRL